MHDGRIQRCDTRCAWGRVCRSPARSNPDRERPIGQTVCRGAAQRYRLRSAAYRLPRERAGRREDAPPARRCGPIAGKRRAGRTRADRNQRTPGPRSARGAPASPTAADRPDRVGDVRRFRLRSCHRASAAGRRSRRAGTHESRGRSAPKALAGCARLTRRRNRCDRRTQHSARRNRRCNRRRPDRFSGARDRSAFVPARGRPSHRPRRFARTARGAPRRRKGRAPRRRRARAQHDLPPPDALVLARDDVAHGRRVDDPRRDAAALVNRARARDR